MSGFQAAPLLRPRPNIGSLLDIPCGRYHKGRYGDNILNGGFSNFIGMGGRGNSFKTAIALSMSLRVLSRQPETSFVLYDTENTFGWDRIEDMVNAAGNMNYDEAVDQGRIILTSAVEHSGEEWWHLIRQERDARVKDEKKLRKATPFIDREGKPITNFPLRIHFLDSMSQLETGAIAEIYEKNKIDDSAANTDAMRGAAIKTRMIMQVPTVTAQGGMALVATAHVGDEIKVDPYAPAKQQLASMKKGLKFKNTPEKFTFLSSNCWLVTEAKPLLNQSSKAPEYPADGFKDAVGDTDLQEISLLNVRSKSGPTGHTFTLIVSQTEGLLPSLTEFHYLKSRKDKFGLVGPEGIHKDWRVALYPDPLLKRTTVRQQVREDKRLARALEITSELAQIYDYWPDFPRQDMVQPDQLRSRLESMGYDWNLLLDTRGYWTFDHYESDVKPLSTMDLIDMYHGRYVPFWYPDKEKLKTEVKSDEKSA
jgi:hypothetical protein